MFAVDGSSVLAVTRPGPSSESLARESSETFIGQVSTRIVENTRPLFSYSYELLFPQASCFDIHTNCPGGVPLSPSSVAACETNDFVSVDYALFDARPKGQRACFQSLPNSSLRSCATVQESTPLFSCAPALFVKNTREGVHPSMSENRGRHDRKAPCSS
jgi:hypothetical protein